MKKIIILMFCMLLLINSVLAISIFGYKIFEDKKVVSESPEKTTQLAIGKSQQLTTSDKIIKQIEQKKFKEPYFSEKEIEEFYELDFAKCLLRNNIGKIKVYISDLDQYYNIELNDSIKAEHYIIKVKSSDLDKLIQCNSVFCVLSKFHKVSMPFFQKINLMQKALKCR